jgi:hypothetical protein
LTDSIKNQFKRSQQHGEEHKSDFPSYSDPSTEQWRLIPLQFPDLFVQRALPPIQE